METHEKKNVEILKKISETLFLPRDVWELTPTSFPVPTPLLKWQTDAEKNDKLLNTCKNHGLVQRVVSTWFFFISLSLYAGLDT